MIHARFGFVQLQVCFTMRKGAMVSFDTDITYVVLTYRLLPFLSRLSILRHFVRAFQWIANLVALATYDSKSCGPCNLLSQGIEIEVILVVKFIRSVSRMHSQDLIT